MNHLDLIAERLASVDITVMKRSVTVRSKAPGSIRTGCYHHVKVTTVSAISWHVDGRRFVAFVDKSGRIRYRELWRHHEPPYELFAARNPAEVLFVSAGWAKPEGCTGRYSPTDHALLHFGPCQAHAAIEKARALSLADDAEIARGERHS